MHLGFCMHKRNHPRDLYLSTMRSQREMRSPLGALFEHRGKTHWRRAAVPALIPSIAFKEPRCYSARRQLTCVVWRGRTIVSPLAPNCGAGAQRSDTKGGANNQLWTHQACVKGRAIITYSSPLLCDGIGDAGTKRNMGPFFPSSPHSPVVAMAVKRCWEGYGLVIADASLATLRSTRLRFPPMVCAGETYRHSVFKASSVYHKYDSWGP